MPEDNDQEMARMKKLEATGLIKLGKGHIPAEFWEIPAPEDKDGSVLKSLLEEREEGL